MAPSEHRDGANVAPSTRVLLLFPLERKHAQVVTDENDAVPQREICTIDLHTLYTGVGRSVCSILQPRQITSSRVPESHQIDAPAIVRVTLGQRPSSALLVVGLIMIGYLW